MHHWCIIHEPINEVYKQFGHSSILHQVDSAAKNVGFEVSCLLYGIRLLLIQNITWIIGLHGFIVLTLSWPLAKQSVVLMYTLHSVIHLSVNSVQQGQQDCDSEWVSRFLLD